MIKEFQKILLAQCLLLVSSLFPLSVFADATIEGLPASHLVVDVKYKDNWGFYLSPYFWLTALSGHVNVSDNRAVFNGSMSKIPHYLDFSLGGHFEASRGPWALLLDSDYVKVTQKPALGGSNGKTTYETTLTDAGAYYRLYSQWSSKAGYIRDSFELLGAGRIITFHTVIDFLNSHTSSLSDTSSVVVPLLGGRIKYNLSPKMHAWLSGDFGGFQVSHVSSTWSTAVGLSYNLTPTFNVTLAYKALGINYSIQAITINTLLQGPVLACGYAW